MDDELPAEVEALRAVPFFADLTPEDLDRIATIGERRSFAADEPIVTKGSDEGGLFVLLSGRATVEAGGRTHELGPGDFVGEMALLAGRTRTATVTATEPVETLVLRTMYFRPFLMHNPSVAVHILGVVAERLRVLQDSLERDDDGMGEGEPMSAETVSYESDIRPLFREKDRARMEFAFDLWSYADVKENADAILERLRDGDMPCDGAWPEEQVERFKRWVEAGSPA